ncbi:hypothetical protein FS837_008344, partial [Tulasnella sp. UAMH 9824]
RLKYSCMMSIDGNFHLQRNHKGTRKDAPLSGNAGFWVDDGELEDYVDAKGARVESQERGLRSSCHSFKAGDPSRFVSKGGKAVSGVAMVSCARHSFIQPNGTVDLEKGERFAYVDVAFASVLRKQNREQRHLHTYDIGCKYGIHFKERVTQSVLESETADETNTQDSMARDVLISPSEFPLDFSIKVPSWHVLGHILPCVLANNLRYTPLVGRTAGEGVETIWAVMNAHQYSTREMTHGHRRDCLTDIFNDYNWLKLCSESRRVSSGYFAACQTFLAKASELRSIEDSIGEERLRALEAEAARRGKDQYGAREVKGPSKNKVLIALKKAEEEDNVRMPKVSGPDNSGAGQISPVLFLSNALELEELQFQLQTRNLDAYMAEGTIGADKRRAQHLRSLDALRRRCEEHLAALKILCPGIPETTFVRAQDPTRQALYLPSGFNEDDQKAYNLSQLVKQEGELRIGSAHDHLNALKDALGLRRMLVEAKKTHARGLGQVTRYKSSVNRASDVVTRHQGGYRRHWIAISRLGINKETDPRVRGLQDLKDGDVQDLRDFIDSDRFSGKTGDLPWIWRSIEIELSPSSSVSEVKQAILNWEHEVLRLTWVHARAVRDRWWEEQALLIEELRRIVASFEFLEASWRVKQPSSSLAPLARSGFRSHALKKAAIFQYLAKEARVQLIMVEQHQRREAQAYGEISESMADMGWQSGDMIGSIATTEVEDVL